MARTFDEIAGKACKLRRALLQAESLTWMPSMRDGADCPGAATFDANEHAARHAVAELIRMKDDPALVVTREEFFELLTHTQWPPMPGGMGPDVRIFGVRIACAEL